MTAPAEHFALSMRVRRAEVKADVGVGTSRVVVYMPTVDAEYRNEGQPNRVPVSRNGQLLPEVLEVLKVMAKHDLGLSTGHISPEEVLMLIRAGKGCRRQQDLRAAPEPRGARDVYADTLTQPLAEQGPAAAAYDDDDHEPQRCHHHHHDHHRSDARNTSRAARAPNLLPCRELRWPDRIAREVALVKTQQLGLRHLTKRRPVVLFEMRRRP